MDWKKLPLRCDGPGSPPSSPHSSAVSAAQGDLEVEALLGDLFTDRSGVSTCRSGEPETERTRQCDNGLQLETNRLHELGAAVELAYADYIVQQREYETSIWTRYPDEEAATIAQPSQVFYEDQDDAFISRTATSEESGVDLNEIPDESRVVQFDVGGTLFRCKASVINKLPGKRLFLIVNDACDRFMDTDTFFIDRSARNFEVILDWYRTGKLFLGADVNMDALEDDAKYFGVYDEMFPVNRERGMATARPQQVQKSNCSSPNLRFSHREKHILSPTSIPVVYRVRTHEQLIVASVKGHGTLLVRVCDPSGMQVVYVDQAVVFDSKSRFYLDGARVLLPLNVLLPGAYVYTFWVGSNADVAATAKSRERALEVEFDLVSTYSKDDLVDMDESIPLNQDRDTTRSEERPKGAAAVGLETLTPALFLPPFMQTLHLQTEELHALDAGKGKRITADRAPRSRINATLPTPKPAINYVARAAAIPRVTVRQLPPNQVGEVPSSPIRRTGAAIISPTKPLGSGRRQEGTITIHRPDKLDFVKRG